VVQDEQPLNDVVSELNSLVRELHRELHFSVDDESGDTIIKVVDRETDEVVRQIPSEDVVRLRQRLQEAAGAIFQDSA
jgi:flagellar protein FlaG